jgi:predicted acylesterase/phospholipase RssA
MNPSMRRAPAVFALAIGVSSCSALRTTLILDQMNGGVSSGESSCPAPQRAALQERASRIAFAAVADSYFNRDAVAQWIDAVVAKPDPIMALYDWSVKHPHPSSTGGCMPSEPATGVCAKNGFDVFRKVVLAQTIRTGTELKTDPSAWNLPAPAVCLQRPATPRCADGRTDSSKCPGEVTLPATACPGEQASLGPPNMWRVSLRSTDAAIPTMIDEERFVSNVASVAGSLVALRNVASPTPTDDDIKAGLIAGLLHAKRYVTARQWSRTLDRPRTSLVLSGGAGTGAFEAGFVNRLLGILQKCSDAQVGGCQGATIDLAVGTSTGSLVAFLVDMFGTPDRAQKSLARKLLRDEYTCSVENDLYCQVNEPITKIKTSVPGLVKFDGIEALLDKYWSQQMNDNATELVTTSVDYQSGDLYVDSDQDPDDAGDKAGRVKSVLASIVEPLMAYPVRELPRKSGTLKGTFIDGGIRSGLPVMEAMYRGAERVVIVSTSSIDPDPILRPEDAVTVVLRTIDLLVQQPRVGEVQQADLAATTRRMSEYNLCRGRYQVVGGDVLADTREIEDFCTRKRLAPSTGPHAQAAVAGWTTPGTLDQVASSWQSAWVYRSEKPIPGMTGYSFDPIGMRKLYLLGIETFQDRCQEVLDLLAIGGDVATNECKRPLAEVQLEESSIFLDENACEAKKLQARRNCPN